MGEGSNAIASETSVLTASDSLKPQPTRDKPRVLLTGATGFVGRYAFPVLEAMGCEVVCATRNKERAERAHPERRWVYLNAQDADSVAKALEGIDVAYYFLHFLDQGQGYEKREESAARIFRDAASAQGVRKVVYLGGVEPKSDPSVHLLSRVRTGALLRDSALPTVELRAAMVLGWGSASWLMVHDLAQRLPAMLLPRWAENHSWPIAVEDAVAALVSAGLIDDLQPGIYDIPGPERITHHELMRETASLLGKHPLFLPVPVVTPRLSSYWIAGVTRAKLQLARELVCGLKADLDPSCAIYWSEFDKYETCPLRSAIASALKDEQCQSYPTESTTQKAIARTQAMIATRRAPRKRRRSLC